MRLTSDDNHAIDRRVFERFALTPGYTEIGVRLEHESDFVRTGHAYDVSEGGLRFDLDEAIEPGTRVAIRIGLPMGPWDAAADAGPGRAVFATGHVVWCDVDDPMSCKLAVAITRFDRAGDKERLLKALSARGFRRAA